VRVVVGEAVELVGQDVDAGGGGVEGSAEVLVGAIELRRVGRRRDHGQFLHGDHALFAAEIVRISAARKAMPSRPLRDQGCAMRWTGVTCWPCWS